MRFNECFVPTGYMCNTVCVRSVTAIAVTGEAQNIICYSYIAVVSFVKVIFYTVFAAVKELNIIRTVFYKIRIESNILDCSANNLIYWPNAQTTANITASGNTFYQKANPIDYTSLYHVDKNAPGYTANASLNIGTQQSVTGNTPADKQSSFASQMALFESGTTNAFWLEN